MPVYIDRDTYSKWNGEVIGQQADLIKQDIAAAPPLPSVDSPSPPPAQPAFQPPTPSDTLTQPVLRATPGPPVLGDLLAAAGLAPSPSPSAGGAATGAQPGAAPALSGGIPSLDSLLQSAGLGDVGGAVGGAVSGAAQTVASAAPPPLADLMRSAGLLDQPKPAQPQQPQTPSPAQPGGAQFGNEVNQFQLGLSDADAYAFCGPAAAIAFSRQYGRNPTAAEARQLAVTVGWSPDQGMAGIDSERALLSKMGVATRMESNGRTDAPAFSWDHVTQDAMNGNPVVLDTPGHYYYVDGARTDNGQVVYHVGQSGLELRGGREWMTAGEINAMSQSKGSVRGALYADNPQTPHPSVANASPSTTQSATQTTAGLSGGGALSGQIGERGQQIMSGAAQAASWLGDQGQKALQAVLMTEGGLNNARGDNGQSAGPLQFYEGGQLANLAQQLGMGLEQAKQWVEQNPIEAVKWAIGTPDKPGYLGGAIQAGLKAGLTGADLATYAQRHGQVSVSPERAGQNFAAMFGGGQGVIQGATGAVQGAGQAAGQTFADLAQSGGNLASQGAALAKGLTQPAGESPTAAVEREANQRMAALQATLNTTIQGTQQAQDQRSVQASTIGGGLAGRGAVNTTDAGGGLTPEQIAGDTTLPVSPENQSLNAQIRGPLGPAPMYQQHPSSGAADATLDAPAGAQSLGAASEMFPTWSQDARSAVLTSSMPRGPVQGTPVPPADYTNASMARPAEPPKPLWAQIGDTIGAAISQGLQPLVQAFQGGPAPVPPTGTPAIVPEGGGYGATGLAPVEQTGPIGQAAIGAGQVAQQVQTPEADTVPLGPVGQAIGTAASAVGTALHAGQEAIRQVSPASGAARTVAGSDEYARQYAALGGVDLEREYRDLVQRRLDGEQGLEPRIQQIGDQLNTINAQITQGQPYEAAISQAAEQNPAFPAIEAAANVGAAGLTLPLAAEGAPLAARVLAEALQPGTNPLEVARGAFELVRGADAADPGTEQAVRAAWESFGQRWSDSAAQRERMLSQIGDPRGFLERVRDNLVSAGGAVARGAQGVLEDISRPTRAGVVGEAPAAANADRFYHGTGSDFPSPDAARFDQSGLFGPGYYVTSDPRVAGGITTPELFGDAGTVVRPGYAQARQDDLYRAYAKAQDAYSTTLADAKAETDPERKAILRDQVSSAWDRLQEVQAKLGTSGPNVRAVDVPKNLNLLDVDAPAPAGLVDRVRKQVGLEGAGFDVQDHLDGLPQKPTGQDVWQAINAGGGGERDYPNAVLQELGFDGIRYEGGKRIPLRDQAGAPIEHTAVVVFPDSLDKLTNATAGTRGGLLPDVAGENLVRQVATRAAVGGTGAGIQESQDPNATPGDVARAAVQGAVLGGARPLIGKGVPLQAPRLLARLAEDVLNQAPSADAATAARDASRDFDLQKLADLRAQYQANEPRLLDAASKPPSWLDRVIGVQAANMLSGVGTAVQNTLGNLGAMVARPATTAAAGYGRDAVRDVAAMGSTLGDAFAAYGRTFRTGQRAGQRYETSLPSGVFAPLSVPLRNLAASDEFFRTLNSAGAAAAEASRRLRENPSLSFDEVLQKHSDDIVKAAADGAARAVYEKGGGAAGELGNWLAQQRVHLLNSENPGLRAVGLGLQWLVPMSRVPAVILGEGIRSLPVINEATGAVEFVRAARAGDTYAARRAVGRTWLTSAANLAIYNQVLAGNITGDGPTNPEEKARLQEAVDQDGNAIWRPNSVRLPGGRWVDYSGLGPIALQMSTIANLSDQAKDEAQKPAEQRADMPKQAVDMLGRTVQTIGNTWYLRGLSDVLGAIKDGNVSKVGSMVGAVGDRFIPAEALLNEIRRIQDPLARQPGNLAERELNRVPFASQLVPPRIASTTGQPLEQPRDVLSTLVRGTPGGMMTPNPVAAEIARLDDTGNRVSVPSPTAQYKGAQQTPEQQRLIQQQIGQATDLYVLHTMQDPKYASLTDVQKADALNRAHTQARDAADTTLGNQVARSPHESALLQWAQTPQYAGVSSRLPPEQIARANWEIEQARSKLSDYRKQYGEQAENRLRREDPTAYRLSQRDRIDKEVLDRKKKAIDKATGGALTQTADTAAAGGLVGVGGTVLRP